jgi:hypothetical protein
MFLRLIFPAEGLLVLRPQIGRVIGPAEAQPNEMRAAID